MPPDLYESLQDLAGVLLQGIHDDPDIPPPEVRVYYQSMKFILRTGGSTKEVPEQEEPAILIPKQKRE